MLPSVSIKAVILIYCASADDCHLLYYTCVSDGDDELFYGKLDFQKNLRPHIQLDFRVASARMTICSDLGWDIYSK